MNRSRFSLVLFVSIFAVAVPVVRAVSSEPSSPQRPLTVNPLEKSTAQGNLNLFNPALGLVLDGVFSSQRDERSNFELRSAELNFTASIDPFANLYAVINATSDEVELEEAAFITTSLPANMTVRGGRFFANFGRLPHWHPHEYPVVEGFKSIEDFVGGESRADGAELLHLFKTPFFLQGTLGAYNKMGAENERLEQTDGNGDGQTGGRGAEAMTYLGRMLSYVPVTDLIGIDIGASYSLTPKQYYIEGARVDDMNTQRHLLGTDITFRYEPTGAGQVGRLLWGTELFRNDERRLVEEDVDTDADGIPDSTVNTYPRKVALGGYTYVDYRFARRWSTGGFFDYSENLTDRAQNEKHMGAMINFLPSEFQRIRLQYSQARDNRGSPINHQVFVQWFGTVGTHVHLFKDR